MHASLVLSDGQVALVDDEDLAACLEHSWTTVGRDRKHVMTYVPGRGPRGGRRICLYLHQFIAKRMGLVIPLGSEIDHRDTDSLNNRRGNLRSATRSQQRMNQSARRDNRLGVKGVCFCKAVGRFQAEIQADKRRHFLGYFDTAEHAGAAYAEAAARFHGNFARTT